MIREAATSGTRSVAGPRVVSRLVEAVGHAAIPEAAIETKRCVLAVAVARAGGTARILIRIFVERFCAPRMNVSPLVTLYATSASKMKLPPS